jgi:hypothetical protein
VGLSPKDRKTLWGRSRHVCAFPQCRRHLTEDQVDATTGETFQTVVGEEAHIYSPSPDGPRYEATFPVTKLETYENRILLCSIHHTLIDSEKGRAYDPETLLAMKRRHEQQEERRERIASMVLAYVADQYEADDKVLFRQVKLEGPRVDAMFVDVPFASRGDTEAALRLARIAADAPGDAVADEGFVVTGAAQALLHPEWTGNALIVGGPGQGKSTLLQFVCQFHRARFQLAVDYTGEAQGLKSVTDVVRVPIRLDLRNYAQWASSKAALNKAKAAGSKRRSKAPERRRPFDDGWPPVERFIADQIGKRSGGRNFKVDDLSTLLATEPVLLALDGLDEVANLEHRDRVANEIVRAGARLQSDAHNLVIVVATRPGMTTSPLWSSRAFPVFYLQKLTAGLRLQYLQRWSTVAELTEESADKLQRTFLEHENLPHIRDLASYPMQLAILLHLLHRRGLLPQQRTELYSEYVQTFLDREQTEEKEPLLSSDRDVIEDIHAFLGWYLQQHAEGSGGAGQISRTDLKQLLDRHLADREKGRKLARQLFAAMESRVLCLIERQPGYFQFEVQSLREYFAAAYVNQYADPRGVGNSRVDCFDALLARPYWLNTCRFFVGMFTKIEVRGIERSLRELQAKPELALHPHLRLAAGRVLDDRAYQGQPGDTIRKIVDFILDGPGVVLAEDGFLDESGQPLTFAEDAGRTQAVLHLQARLTSPTPDGTRRGAARMLRRHVERAELTKWWWSQFQPNGDWFRSAADLSVVTASGADQEANLAAAASAAETDAEWAVELLARGGYAGNADQVLAVCKQDISDGAFEVLRLDASTPLGKLVSAARTAVTRPVHAGGGNGANTRTRFRASAGPKLVAELVTATEPLRACPAHDADATVWADRLVRIGQIWGGGWLTRQAVALLPGALDLGALARHVTKKEPSIASALQREEELRTHRSDPDWWRSQWQAASGELDRRSWLFSMLTAAHLSVVLQLAAEVNAAASALTPRHYRAMESALAAFMKSAQARQLTLHEPLRRGQVSFSGRSLWLLHLVATDGSGEQIEKKFAAAYEELLQPGMGDRRPVLRFLGQRKMTKIDGLKGSRDNLPPGAWAAEVKLGAMKAATVSDALQHPEEWPLEIVGKAIQAEVAKVSRQPPIARIAIEDRWFQAGG